MIVVDFFSKGEGRTLVGDNLATRLWVGTKVRMIIKGVIRTLEGIHPIDMAAYYRAAHPSAIRKVKPTEVNVLRRIGSTAVMPGDVAFGGSESVSLIPPHPIVDKAEETPIHDERAQMRLNTGKYKSTDLFSSRENPAFKAEDEECERSKLTK